jgi:hypothetical protein
VDAKGDRGLAEALVAGGAAMGLGSGGGARGPWAGRGPVAGGGTMGTRAGGGATHTYRDSRKSVIRNPRLLNIPKIISILLNIIYDQKPFVTLKIITDKAMDENYPLQFNRIDCFLSKYLLAK